MAGSDNLLENEFIFRKIGRKAFKRLVKNRRRKVFLRIGKFSQLLRPVILKAQDTGFLIGNEKPAAVSIKDFCVDMSSQPRIVNRKRLCRDNLPPVRPAQKMHLCFRKNPEIIEFFTVDNAVAAHGIKTFRKIVLHQKHGLGNPHPHRGVYERRGNFASARESKILKCRHAAYYTQKYDSLPDACHSAFVQWLRLMCYNFPFAYFTQLFFIQPFVRSVFRLIFSRDRPA